jgi:hypothetical protein
MKWVVADGGEGQWVSLLTPEVIIALLIVLLVLLVIAVIAGLIVYRRFRRSPKWGRRLPEDSWAVPLHGDGARSNPKRRRGCKANHCRGMRAPRVPHRWLTQGSVLVAAAGFEPATKTYGG